MTNHNDGVYEGPEESSGRTGGLAARDERTEVEQTRLRVVVLRDFVANAALKDDERAAYCRRFCTLFVDESSMRKGGVGTVYRVENALGEQFALKILHSGQKDDGPAATAADERAFEEEYRCHQIVQGTKGFPKLYGKGTVDGDAAMVMEWISGVSLREAAAHMAVNDAGMLSPLMAARIGRDLFALVERMDFVGEGVVHRDISPSNIMIRTSRIPLQEQVDDGRFDLFLIDFGSALAVTEGDPTFTAATGVVRKATANYAPPEMLTNDIAGIAELRQSPQVDVYAAASVIYELATGSVPFDFSEAPKDASFYRIKTEQSPSAPTFAHQSKTLGEPSLARDPELSVMLEGLRRSEKISLDDDELWDAIAFVDAQLAALIMPCLSASQNLRPTAQEMSGALSSFARNYERNLRSSYIGEPLIPCILDGMPEGNAEYLIALRNTVKTTIKAASLGLFTVVIASSGLLVAGIDASSSAPGLGWLTSLMGFDVSACLALPALAGFAARGKGRETLSGFLRASIALIAAAACVGYGFESLSLPSDAINRGLLSALFASSASAWCALVMDYAFAVVVPLARRIKRKGLPAAALPQREQLPEPMQEPPTMTNEHDENEER